MGIPRASSLLLSFLSLVLLPTPSTANDNNILLTGDVLRPDCQLSYLDASFTMRSDCDLVLYAQSNPVFSSSTYDEGAFNCSAVLNQYGQIIISDPLTGRVLWVSGDPGPQGKYAAVLKPDGNLGIYGPPIWSTLPVITEGEDTPVGEVNSVKAPLKNTLFSTEILEENDKLTTRDYTLAMDDSCSLNLHRGSEQYLWVSGTAGLGAHCFLRLNRLGQLTIKDDKYKTLWSTAPSSQGEGEYVLILQYNGQAAVYGPMFWAADADDADITRIASSPKSQPIYPQPMPSQPMSPQPTPSQPMSPQPMPSQPMPPQSMPSMTMNF
ncbi:hypothetical protein OPV22_009877 [Ensete ventricosum]|uniref:Bulb-type lectin domain-containing protein n=1 Tax=Ensete ventricosum TaxID=4639 RepID=A0AAV8Q0W5_ENSVE|nr:hypothetical protein OPV22_009877 [Ensete ventricosum]